MVGHLGVFRLLRASLRVVGYDVEQLFVDPLLATSLGDFWGRRWNVAFSDMNRAVIVAPVKSALADLKAPKWIVSPASIVSSFAASAVFHEFAITVPVGAGYGRPSLFFLLHGLLVVFEKQPSVSALRERFPTVTRLLVMLALILPLPMLFVIQFRTEIALPVALAIATVPSTVLDSLS